ncbi:MAG: CbiQ family ECF transporter T component [Nitrososphaerales archaeon]
MAHLVRLGLDFFRDLIVSEGYQSNLGFMQRLDVRVKLFGVAAVIVLTVLTQSAAYQAAVLIFCYALTYLSNIPLSKVAGRSLFIIVPAFIIALPRALLGAFSPVGFGFQPFSDVWGFLLLFTLRVAAASTALILLTSTTGFSGILSCLRWLKFPKMLLWVMAMTHRYLLVLSSELYKLALGRESRVHKDLSVKSVWKEGGKMLGTFFMRSLERGERVQMAALSRSGGADLKSYLPQFRISAGEAAFILFIVILIYLGLVVSL